MVMVQRLSRQVYWCGVMVVLGAAMGAGQPVRAQEGMGPSQEAQWQVREQTLRAQVRQIQEGLRALTQGLEGMSRSELSDQPTRSMKESLESLPGVSVRQGPTGRDPSLPIRGSK